MCVYNPNEALGCPPGSVRAILALIVVSLVTSGSIILMFLLFVSNQHSYALGILSGLTGFTGTILGYYFGSKTAEKASKEIVLSHTREIESKNGEIEMLTRNMENSNMVLTRNMDALLARNV